jgi:hypothetical protein
MQCVCALTARAPCQGCVWCRSLSAEKLRQALAAYAVVLYTQRMCLRSWNVPVAVTRCLASYNRGSVRSERSSHRPAFSAVAVQQSECHRRVLFSQSSSAVRISARTSPGTACSDSSSRSSSSDSSSRSSSSSSSNRSSSSSSSRWRKKESGSLLMELGKHAVFGPGLSVWDAARVRQQHLCDQSTALAAALDQLGALSAQVRHEALSVLLCCTYSHATPHPPCKQRILCGCTACALISCSRSTWMQLSKRLMTCGGGNLVCH